MGDPPPVYTGRVHGIWDDRKKMPSASAGATASLRIPIAIVPTVSYGETLQQTPMVIVSLRCAIVDHFIDSESRGDPANADGDCSLRCAIADHSIDSESRVAPADADGVLFQFPIRGKTLAIADGDCSLRCAIMNHFIIP